MSELYLTLRSKLREVADWVEIPSEVLITSRKRVGSRESVAHLMNMSAKTLERYEKAGRIPRHLVPLFRDVVGLQIEEPAAMPVTISPATGPLAQLGARVEAVEDQLHEMTGALHALLELLGQSVEETAARHGDGPAPPRERRHGHTSS